MVRLCVPALLCAAAQVWCAAAARQLRASLLPGKVALERYTFAQFARDFPRSHNTAAEYEHRASLFEVSLLEIHETNARNVREGRAWTAGAHRFMDWTSAEKRMMNGYKPSRTRGSLQMPMAALQVQETHHAQGRSNATLASSFTEGGASGLSQVRIRNQGNCGSCWAISAAEAVEAQLVRSGSDDSVRVSAQALVDCVPNPQHCGGTGGCDGATGELAYTYMRDHGIPLDSEAPYTGETQTCPQQQNGKIARVSAWNNLPSNKAEPLMHALVQDGPAVVAVDANDWFNYEQGVFDGCKKDAILVHAVLAKGYGDMDGQGYWLIQNSWGAEWGEHGHIRLLRHKDEGAWCGIDNKPQEGMGCDGGPAEITVCGMCGILFDPIIPQGVSLA